MELVSAFDVTLSDPRADEAHPAFTNLFVRAEWLAAQQALLFERQPRLPTEPALQMAHFLADSDPQVVGLRIQTDRQRWLGRNQAASQPLAEFDTVPVATAEPSARLTFATAASDHGGTLHAMIDKYRQPSHVKRASLMSATLTGIRLRALRISPENFAAVQTLTTALLLSLTRPTVGAAAPDPAALVCDRRLLWGFGISGDLPILLVQVSVMQGLGLLRAGAGAAAVVVGRRRLRSGGAECRARLVPDGAAARDCRAARSAGHRQWRRTAPGRQRQHPLASAAP